ncbi:response regulator [Streptomyces sp. NPDC090025]|uniref:response regulator n=1 Tax=Streptomyces sp. NPDC090025 TaxID=3365922 RepID=UPI003833D7FF
MEAVMPVRVLIADAEEVVRVGLRSMLTADGEFEVVGDTGDGREAVRRALDAEPDVCVIGSRLDGADGLDMMRRLAAAGCSVVVLTGSGTDESICAALRAGVQGILCKTLGAHQIRQGIWLAAAGAYPLSPAAVESLRAVLHRYGQLPYGGPHGRAPGPARTLTPSELQVAGMVAAGRTDREIAQVRGVSVSAVKKTVIQCRHKVDARNRLELAHWAWRRGLEPVDRP